MCRRRNDFYLFNLVHVLTARFLIQHSRKTLVCVKSRYMFFSCLVFVPAVAIRGAASFGRQVGKVYLDAIYVDNRNDCLFDCRLKESDR